MGNINKVLAIILILAIALFSYFHFSNTSISELGLKVLSFVKQIKGEAVDLSKLEESESNTVDHVQWTELLNKHVAKNGMVDYRGFIRDSVLLNEYLNTISKNPPGTKWSEKQELSYWINAYNAFTIQLILDHYPVSSIKEIGGSLTMINSPWDIKFFKIGGVEFDLNTIEHEILRKKFDEPRIHFAINCASISCPDLRSEAFVAEKLYEQLNEQTKLFLNNPQKNLITKSELKISKIFSWFEVDFTKDEDLKSYLSEYNSNVNPNLKIEYMDYDWSLNDQSKSRRY